MKIISSAEMREIDRRTAERFGVPMLTLMENAGTAVAEFVLRESAASESVGVICGKGNNGGDGLVAARKLHEAGRQVQVLLLADPAEVKGDAAAMLPKVPVPVIAVRNESDLADDLAQQVFTADILVDAVLGTGFKPPVQGLYAAAIARMNGAGKRIVAVDVPSGLDADALLPQAAETQIAAAQQTVSFTAPRPGQVFSGVAGVHVAGIGSPAEAIESKMQLDVITPLEIAALLRPRAADANKGAFGHVLVIGGSVGKAGAAAMAGMAALRAGAGLATVATARSVLATVAGFAPEIMTEPLAETEEGTISLQALESGRMDALLERKNVVAIGPGISRHPDTAYFVRELLRSTAATVVLDADGLNAFEGCAEVLEGSDARPLVLTPHPGEMARLAGMSVQDVQADRLGVARRFASEHHCIVVLKGWRTVIAEPSGEAWANTTGNPGMAKGGSGDILTGMVAGLLAQFPQQTARATAAAVYLHGLAGDVARELVGEMAMTATDLLRTLPAALARVSEAAGDRFVRVT